MKIPVTTLFQSLLFFALCAIAVWIAGARLAYLADALADRFKLAKSIVGLLLLSLATSLPEVATTLTAAIGQARDLVLRCRPDQQEMSRLRASCTVSRTTCLRLVVARRVDKNQHVVGGAVVVSRETGLAQC